MLFSLMFGEKREVDLVAKMNNMDAILQIKY
jgi:hypothetical protein